MRGSAWNRLGNGLGMCFGLGFGVCFLNSSMSERID
jgi:hypothetical protein